MMVETLCGICPSISIFTKKAVAAHATEPINGLIVVERKSGTIFVYLMSRYIPITQINA